jgi:predicted short-subunit dehydrogenase-like oxidoreductase (DUF2520 family)
LSTFPYLSAVFLAEGVVYLFYSIPCLSTYKMVCEIPERNRVRSKNKNTISIIGAGKVGSTLAMLLSRAGYRIVSVISRNQTSARKLARLVHCPHYSTSLSDVHPATKIICIAVPEENILEIAEEISKSMHIDFSKLAVFHTSGSLSSDALLTLRRKSAITFSLHPIQSFSKSSSLARQMDQMQHSVYGFEGEKAAIPIARRLVKSLHGVFVTIPKEEKILYHIASVFASNYSIALLGVVDDVVKRIGGELTLAHFKPLVRTSIENAFRQTPVQALTGPIARGSFATIKNQLQQLQNIDPSLAVLYQHIGLQALKMAETRKSMKPKIAKQIRQILEPSITSVKEKH